MSTMLQQKLWAIAGSSRSVQISPKDGLYQQLLDLGVPMPYEDTQVNQGFPKISTTSKKEDARNK